MSHFRVKRLFYCLNIHVTEWELGFFTGKIRFGLLGLGMKNEKMEIELGFGSDLAGKWDL